MDLDKRSGRVLILMSVCVTIIRIINMVQIQIRIWIE